MTGIFRERRRRLGIAGLTLGLLVSAVPFLSASPASADTPTITETVVASTTTQTNVAKPGPLTGLNNGDVVTLRVTDASSTDQVSAIVAIRECEASAPINNPGDLGPTDTGYCIDQPFNASSDAVKTDISKAQLTDNFIQTTFRVGTGSRDVAYDNGSPHTNTITCDATSPCSLWVQIGKLQSGSNDLVHYDLNFQLSNPDAPTIAATATADGAHVTATPPVNTGGAPITSYTYSATATDGGPSITPVTTAATTADLHGMPPFKHYDVTAIATNGGGLDSVASNAVNVTPIVGAPVLAPATVSPGHAVLSWTYGGPAGQTGFLVTYTDTTAATPAQTQPVSGGSTLTTTLTGLTNGDLYSATVHAVYADGSSGESNQITFSPPPDTILTQTITVRRPEGALVLTQQCGATAASPVGTAPTTPGPGGTPDPLFMQYPYPVDANGVGTATYPTDCGIVLGTAHLITSGPGKGQFFEATGDLNEVSVVDTRDTDPGWTVNGRMSTFTASPSLSFPGDELGWAPSALDTDQATFSDGTTYDQTVTPGDTVPPNTLTSSGLGLGALPNGQVLGSADPGFGLGIATLDAALDLYIPINARTGDYTGTLTITAV